MSYVVIVGAKILASIVAHCVDEINQGVDKVLREQLETSFEKVTTSPEVIQLVQEIIIGIMSLNILRGLSLVWLHRVLIKWPRIVWMLK